MLLLRFLDLAIFYRDNEADIRPRWLYSTATASLISSPTFHRSRRAAYREYLWIKSALSRLISGLRFRQNRQVGQVYPTSRGQISSGRIYVPRKNEKNPRDSIPDTLSSLYLSLSCSSLKKESKVHLQKYLLDSINLYLHI